jgi:hypothetical protein
MIKIRKLWYHLVYCVDYYLVYFLYSEHHRHRYYSMMKRKYQEKFKNKNV